MSTSGHTQPAEVSAGQRIGVRWAVRRALLGVAIMVVTVGLAACLLYFTIDPDAEARAEGDGTGRSAAAIAEQDKSN